MLKCGFGTYIKAWQVTGSRQWQNILSLDVFWKLNVVCAACIYTLQAGWFKSSYLEIYICGRIAKLKSDCWRNLQENRINIGSVALTECCTLSSFIIFWFLISKWACYYTNNITYGFYSERYGSSSAFWYVGIDWFCTICMVSFTIIFHCFILF